MMLAVHFTMNHINLWIAHHYVPSYKWKYLVMPVLRTAVVVLIHIHVQPKVTLVHIDAVIPTGLVLHLDHPDVLIGVIHLR